MIYLMGDMHGTHEIGERLNTKNFPEQKELTRDDYVIIVGDFGFPWCNDKEDTFWLKWMEKKNFQILFIDGNHENFDLLEAYPEEEWMGGVVHRLAPNIRHLKRGHVFTIEGKTFFTFGGAASTDKEFRKEGISWWAREMPSKEEYALALRTLDVHQWSVDYMLTHTTANRYVGHLFMEGVIPRYETDELTTFLDEISSKLTFKKWFFGHFHQDFSFNPTTEVIYKGRVLL